MEPVTASASPLVLLFAWSVVLLVAHVLLQGMLATKELGKAVRTLFLLKYIDDGDVRKMIGAATNKSEQFNAFVKWIFFGNDRVIAENVAYEQQKLVKYSHVVANLVMLHTLDGMTRVLWDLRAEGHTIDEELLRGLSPYRNGHINRFGDYRLDLSRRTRDPTLIVLPAVDDIG